METKDIIKHVVWALVISVGWWLLTWIFGQILPLGSWIKEIISMTFMFGLLFYAINAKGWMHGFVAGIIYAIVFLLVSIVIVILLNNPLGGEIAFFNYKSFDEMFKWDTGIYLKLIGFLLFTSFIGWANEHK